MGSPVAKGRYDKESKKISYTDSIVDPTLESEVKLRETITFTDENTHSLKIYSNYDGNEYNSVEIVFTGINKYI